jgi:hypothetical protein
MLPKPVFDWNGGIDTLPPTSYDKPAVTGTHCIIIVPWPAAAWVLMSAIDPEVGESIASELFHSIVSPGIPALAHELVRKSKCGFFNRFAASAAPQHKVARIAKEKKFTFIKCLRSLTGVTRPIRCNGSGPQAMRHQ